MVKICNKCKIKRDIISFNKRKDSKDGFYNECNFCKKEYSKKYYIKNKIKIKEYIRKYNIENKDKIKKYHQNNRKTININHKNKVDTNPLFKMSCNLRARTRSAFKQSSWYKNTKTLSMLGCDFKTAHSYLETQFTKGMSWNNYGKWHIDHIIPLSSAKTEEELIKLCHYTNLQPLWAIDNFKKGAKLITPFKQIMKKLLSN